MNLSCEKTPKFQLKRLRPHLGTFVEISAVGESTERVGEAIQKAFSRIAFIENLLSFHNPQSELSKLNQIAAQGPVSVHHLTYEVIALSLRMHHLSSGLFDCCVAPFLVRWGYLPKHNQTYPKNYSSQNIKLLDNFKVEFTAPLWLDLGGIAKGFAVDQAVSILKDQGMESGCVNAGGDLSVFGDTKQPIHVKSPLNNGELIYLADIANGAVATSSCYYSAKQWRGQRVNCLVNPHSEKPVHSYGSVSVFAQDCWMADALTKIITLTKETDPKILKDLQATAAVLKFKNSRHNKESYALSWI